MSEDIATNAVKFKKNGDLTQDVDGQPVVVAHYTQATGHLEFATEEASRKLYNQITSRIGTVNKGTQPSGLKIVKVSIKGRPMDEESANIPKKPKQDPNYGDATPELVAWYFKYKPKEAALRYQVFLDKNGDPVRRRVKRKVLSLVDDRNGGENLDGKRQFLSAKEFITGPVGERADIDVLEDQIIARRATPMTFTPNEVIGGFEVDDEDESVVLEQE